jgi:RNA polymerase sigma-70 factor (ECF subfamily)
MAGDSENELIARHLAGDPSAFEQIFELHHRQVANLAYRMLRNEDAALDAAQETFVRAFRELERWRGDAKLSTWLYRTTLNVCFERLRAEEKQSKLREMPPRERSERPTPDDSAERAEMLEAVNAAISTLPPQQRAIFVLKQYHDLRFSEIAAMMNISEGGAKASYHKAIVALRGKLRRFSSIAGRAARS